MQTPTTQRPARRSTTRPAAPFSPAAAKLIQQIQADARAALLEELSAKDGVTVLHGLEPDTKRVHFDSEGDITVDDARGNRITAIRRRFEPETWKTSLHLTSMHPLDLRDWGCSFVMARGWAEYAQRGQHGHALPPLMPWLCAAAIALLLGSAHLLDGPADHSAEWGQSQALQADLDALAAHARFERAAQAMCEPNGAWTEPAPGVVQCTTHRGHPTHLAQVQP